MRSHLCVFSFHIRVLSLLLVHSIKGLLTCNSCRRNSNRNSAVKSDFTEVAEAYLTWWLKTSRQSRRQPLLTWVESVGRLFIFFHKYIVSSYDAKHCFVGKERQTLRYDRSRKNGLVVSRFLFVKVSYHTLPSLGSVTQLNPAVVDLDAMPNETQLTGKKG